MKSKQNLSLEDFEKLREKLREENGIESPSSYKCIYCDQKVNFMFPMKLLKDQQICPDCWEEQE